MLGFGKSKPVAEHEAGGEIERVYHEIRQVMRVPGVNLNFRTWATFEKFFPAMWDAMRENAETRAFEDAGALVRTAAMERADAIGRLDTAAGVSLGESQAWQIMKAVDLYHYINPKLLVFTAAVRRALHAETAEPQDSPVKAATLARGVSPKMYPMEMIDEQPDDERLRALFRDIKQTFSLSQINSDYRTLALWPDYLDAAWQNLKPLAESVPFRSAAEELRGMARSLACTLPHPIPLSRERVEELGEDADAVMEKTNKFEELLPSLILVIALLKRDWRSPDAIAEKLGGAAITTPAREGTSAERAREPWRAFQCRQRVTQLGDQFISYVEEGSGEPVVLLHGIPTWGWLWHDLIPRLSATHRVLVPDLPGFGFSSKADCFDRSIAHQAEWIDQWMGQLGVERAAIVAHDIGGGVALRLATLFPDRVERLCVMNSVCYDSWPIELMLQFGHPEAYRKLSAKTTVPILKQGLKMGFAKSPSGEFLDGVFAPYRTEVGKLSLIRNAAALNTNLTTEITPLLSQIGVPSLILWGEDDTFQLVKYAERLAGDIRGASLVRIKDARHFVMIDQPETVARELGTFL